MTTVVGRVREHVSQVAARDPAEARRIAIAWVVGVAVATELGVAEDEIGRYADCLIESQDAPAGWMDLARWAGQCDLPDDCGPVFGVALGAAYRKVRSRLTPLDAEAFVEIQPDGL